ncbi:MAG: glycosyltransferase family 2 protein [Candidatus Lokiarchaeota archaeon]|nr:glycosyltransferase family 2 protein [Candidatus Lokiarchaeota archaeon]
MSNSYAIITPAYNEESFIDNTIRSVINQSILPSCWVIVNDGSIDRTSEIIKKYLPHFNWIKLIEKTRDNTPFGVHAVENFKLGLKFIDKPWNYIVKLDADLSIDRADYFEYQLYEFSKNKLLGISSGITYYYKQGKKIVAKHPSWRTTGALKMYRKECFDSMGGLTAIYGWDGLDDYKARYNNWKTKTFFNLEVNHLAKERDINRHSSNKIFFKKGESFYLRGYSLVFIILKSIQILIKEKKIQKASHFFKGFYYSSIQKTEKVVTINEQRFIRHFQIKRFFHLIND